jgi:hypothetical protein
MFVATAPEVRHIFNPSLTLLETRYFRQFVKPLRSNVEGASQRMASQKRSLARHNFCKALLIFKPPC